MITTLEQAKEALVSVPLRGINFNVGMVSRTVGTKTFPSPYGVINCKYRVSGMSKRAYVFVPLRG